MAAAHKRADKRATAAIRKKIHTVIFFIARITSMDLSLANHSGQAGLKKQRREWIHTPACRRAA